MKDPRGLIIVGETVGNLATESYFVGDEAFIVDHFRGVVETIMADFHKIGCLRE